MKKKKIKVLTLGDMPLGTSGVGNQSRFFIEALLQTGKFEVFTLGGAIKHPEYKLMKTEQWGDDWKILPVDKFGTKELIRSILWREKPDLVWIMTDPRFWGWLWEMDTEIRKNVPIVYYHVWDNYPAPQFNRQWYVSNDVVATISKVTDDIVSQVAPKVERRYIPHAVDPNIFKTIPEPDRRAVKLDSLGPEASDKMVFFWNNRNARRKQSGSLVLWFNEFAEEVG